MDPLKIPKKKILRQFSSRQNLFIPATHHGLLRASLEKPDFPPGSISVSLGFRDCGIVLFSWKRPQNSEQHLCPNASPTDQTATPSPSPASFGCGKGQIAQKDQGFLAQEAKQGTYCNIPGFYSHPAWTRNCRIMCRSQSGAGGYKIYFYFWQKKKKKSNSIIAFLVPSLPPAFFLSSIP